MLELNRIYLMDVIEGLKQIPEESIDIIIADPPYNIGKDFGLVKDNLPLKEYVEWSMKWINLALNTLKRTGTMFIFGLSEILPYLFVNINANKRWLIWHYTNKNTPNLHFWQRSHEAILCIWKDSYIFNEDDIREPYTETFLKYTAGKIRKETKGRFSKGNKQTVYRAHEKGALPRDVIKIPALAGGVGRKERWFYCEKCKDAFPSRDKVNHINHEEYIHFHPTQKPLELCRRLILSCKPKDGGVVLVPFVGSGSECVAAKELGLDFIGFEINPFYVKIAERRLAS